jgi:phospholipid-translocating ATPase
MLLLILWIAIYSFFETINFNGEIGVLFQTIDFWTAVVLSVVFAVGSLRHFYRLSSD